MEKNVCFKIDGENAPLDGFKLDFDGGDYMRLYRNLGLTLKSLL